MHEFVTILMDSAILSFGFLPWFWKVSHFVPCLIFWFDTFCSYTFFFNVLCSLFLVTAVVWRVSGVYWFQCWKWDITHSCIFSWRYVLVTGENEILHTLVTSTCWLVFATFAKILSSCVRMVFSNYLVYNPCADNWFTIFLILNFCHWGPPWFQQGVWFTFIIWP